MFTRGRKPLRTAFTLGHNKCTENKGWQDWLAPVLGAMHIYLDFKSLTHAMLRQIGVNPTAGALPMYYAVAVLADS